MNLRNFLLSFRTVAMSAVVLVFTAAPACLAGTTLTNIFSFPADQVSGGGLAQGTNGNFYGTTLPVGTNNDGTVFMLSSAGVFTNLVTFTGGNGSRPDAPLLLASDGNFYGTTSRGGASNCGTIFSISPSGVFISRTNFGGGNGEFPVGGLVQATNQIFYGATTAGGANGFGAVYSYSVTNGLTLIYSFTGTNDGAYPGTGVLIGANGDLYGTTYLGGTNGVGTVFQLSTGGALTTLAQLSFTNGAFPVGLVQATNGNLYGATFSGGSNGLGAVFELSTRANSLSVLVSFAITNGSNPDGPLLIASDGLIYGTTEQGGASGKGIIFQVSTNVGRVGRGDPANTNSALGAEDSLQGAVGEFPEAGLLQGSDGNFYGTTSSGGANGTGTVFEVLGFAPTIILPPTNLSLALGGTAVFSVQAGGSAPLYYQWLVDGAKLANVGNISGANSNVLTIGPEVLTNSASYSVIITNAFGSVTSAVALLTVPLPTLTLKAPPANVTDGTLALQGTAAGKYGVTNVIYEVVPGTNWLPVDANGWPNAPASTNWTANVALQAGTNVIKAYSVDPLGNHSLTNSVTVFYLTHSLLTLATNGPGSVSPKVSTTNLIVGKSYKVSATPAKGYLFSNWVGSLTNSGNPLTFLMVSNMVLQADFVANPFLMPEVSGPFNGLFSVATNVAPATSGLLKNLKVGTTGIFTAALYIGGSNYSVGGNFNLAGNASSQITRKAPLGTLTLAMNLDWNSTPPQVTGTVSEKNGGAWTASLLAELAGSNLASAAYTLLIPPGTNPAAASPPGYGYATITNFAGTAKLPGSATILGALADGTAFSENIAESSSSNLTIFATPYSNDGLLIGWLTLTNGTPEGELTWIRPPATNGLYPSGYTNVVTVQSSPWTDLGSQTAAISLADGVLTVSNTSPNLDFNFTNVVVSNTDALLNLSGEPTNKLSGTINAKTGALTISISDAIGKTSITGSGVILQNQTNGAGYFTTKTNGGSILLQ